MTDLRFEGDPKPSRTPSITSTYSHSNSLQSSATIFNRIPKPSPPSASTMSNYNTTDPFEIRHTKQVHDEILAASYAHHTSVRETAERALNLLVARAQSARVQQDTHEAELVALNAEKEARRLKKQVEKAKKAQEEAVQAQNELLRIERDRIAQEEAQRQAIVAQEQDSQRKAAEEESRRQQEAAARAQRDQEAAEARRQQESLAKAQHEAQQQNLQQAALQSQKPTAAATPAPTHAQPASTSFSVPNPQGQVNSSRSSDLSNCAPLHNYTTIHKTLKHVRKLVKDLAASQNPVEVQYAKECNHLRREIQKGVSQLQADGKNSATVFSSLRTAVETAKKRIPEHPDSVLSQPGDLYFVDTPKGTQTHVSLMLIYILNSMSRSVIKQWVMEAGDNPAKAQAVAILALRVFCYPDAKWNGEAFLDILLCKIYVNCPVLLSARGDEASDEGKIALGWRQAKDGDGNRMFTGQGNQRRKVFVDDQVHYSRMKGIAAGFGAIALRYFKAGNNPCPPHNYWQSLSRVLRCPPNEVSSSHCVVLQGMIQGEIAQIIKFYGRSGMQVLANALIRFPAQWIISKESDKAIKGSLQALAAKVNKDMDPDLMQVEPIPGY